MIGQRHGEFTLIKGFLIAAGDISGIRCRYDAAQCYPDVVLDMELRQRDKIVQQFFSRPFVLLSFHVTGDRDLPELLGCHCGIV